MKNKILSFLIAGVIVLSMGIPAAQAADEPVITNYETTGSDEPQPSPEYDEGHLLADRPAPDGFTVSSVDVVGLNRPDRAFPASYTSLSVTSVKNQNPYGTCWAFSTVGSAEAELVNNNGENKSSLDLSEIQLAYFTYNSVVDPLGGLAGDSIILPADQNFLNAGGNRLVSSFVLASWVGLTPEAATSPVTYSNVAPSTTLSSNLARGANYAALRNAIWINSGDSDSIKQMVISYGAVSMSYWHHDTYYNSATSAYYNNVTGSTNHAVIIVGWDDNYSASNFREDRRPAGNGAWLVKNSWGTGWGTDGYFWISYEDKCFAIAGNYCVVYDMGPSENYLHNYQYDGNGSLAAYTVHSDTAYMANIFTAASNESVKSVMFATYNTNVDYSIQIYRNPSPGNPASGTACLSTPVTGSTVYEGYHTVDLPQSVPLNEGDTFSVVVGLSDVAGEIYLPIDYTSDWEWVNMVGSAQPGQSFTSQNGTSWTDTDISHNTNVRVKALTVENYNISYVLDGGSLPANAPVKYGKGDTITLPIPTRGGYEFKGWYNNGSFSGSPVTQIAATETGEKTFYAKWYRVAFTVTAAANNASYGSVSGSGVYNRGATATLTAVPNAGYRFVQWTANGSPLSTNPDYSFTVTQDISLTAEFAAQTPVNIQCSKTDATLYGSANGSITISASGGDSGRYDYSINGGASWQSSNVFGGLGVGIYTAAVRDAGYPSNIATCSVTINQPAYVGSVPAKKISSKPNAGTAVTIIPPAAPKGYTTISVTYSSSNPAVAAVDGSGNVTFISGGKATIITKIILQKVDSRGRVRIKTTTIKKGVTVKQPVSSISLNPGDATIERKQKVKLITSINPVTASSKKVKWTTSNRKVATVSSSGVVTGRAAGTAVITCIAKDGSGASASCTVTVTPVYPAALKLSKKALTMKTGKTATLKATITPRTTDFKTATWVSSNPAVVTVDAKGKVKAITSGTAVITATTINGISASCTVTVP